MPDTKYYDYANTRPLTLESDGCELHEWSRLYGDSRYARHPSGFKIFLSPDRLAACDEYAGSDPYTVEQNLESEFHERRIELTIELLQKVDSSVQGTPTILDLGCGQGHITHAMYQTLKSSEISGLDYSLSAIEYAHNRFPGIDFIVGDAYDAPYSEKYFDVIVCNNLWEHVPDPLYLLGKVKRLLKPHGYVIVSTPSRYHLGNLVRIIRGKRVALMSEHHVTEYTVGQVIEQFAYGGFKVDTILSKRIIGSMKYRIVRRLFESWASLVGSHHQLDTTIFYLAQKSPDDGQ